MHKNLFGVFMTNSFLKNNTPFMLVCISVFISLLFAAMLYLSINYASKIDIASITFDNNSENFKHNVDKIDYTKQNKYLSISGWIFKKDEDIKIVSSYYALYDEQDNKFIKLPSKMVTRNDVPKHFKINKKISNSGIKSIIKLNKLNPNHTYKLYVLYQNNENNFLVFTNKQINGKGEIIK